MSQAAAHLGSAEGDCASTPATSVALMSAHAAPQQRRTPRPRRYSARPFFLSLLALCVLATLSLAAGKLREHTGNSLGPRAAGTPGAWGSARDDEVRIDSLTPLAPLTLSANMCIAWPTSAPLCAPTAPTRRAGLFSYLALYYCRLDHAHVLAFAILVLWLAMLFTTIGIAASDFFCINLSTIANILGMSESMAGVTFLALGNGSPDVFSTFAAMRTHSGSLAVGELIGAASFITSVVAGSMALIQPFEVPKRAFVRDLGFFTVAASFSMAFLYDGRLFPWECVVMIVFYVFYVCTVIVWHWWLGRRRRRGEEAVAAAASGGRRGWRRSHVLVSGPALHGRRCLGRIAWRDELPAPARSLLRRLRRPGARWDKSLDRADGRRQRGSVAGPLAGRVE